jgi:hypothetical protein
MQHGTTGKKQQQTHEQAGLGLALVHNDDKDAYGVKVIYNAVVNE